MEAEEARTITGRVFEHVLGLRRSDMVLQRDEEISQEIEGQLMSYLERLEKNEPVQYVLQEAPFLGRTFFVDTNVLIPRPETEELVEWMLESTSGQSAGHLIDLGTGSGCIPISFQLARPEWHVKAIDISVQALEVAARNASVLNSTVIFEVDDLLSPNSTSNWRAQQYDVIVSNPPYIPLSERETLHERVRDREPSQALFTPDDDPLLFYRAIKNFAIHLLKPGGSVFLEVHENYAAQTLALFQHQDFSSSVLKNDFFGKPRMIRAVR